MTVPGKPKVRIPASYTTVCFANLPSYTVSADSYAFPLYPLWRESLSGFMKRLTKRYRRHTVVKDGKASSPIFAFAGTLTLVKLLQPEKA